MNDFATEEFLSKNIRVRPLSGVTRGDEDGKTNDPYTKSMNDPYGQNVDETDKMDQMKIFLEMEEQRKEAKLKRDDFLERKQKEEEKAAKKRR